MGDKAEYFARSKPERHRSKDTRHDGDIVELGDGPVDREPVGTQPFSRPITWTAELKFVFANVVVRLAPYGNARSLLQLAKEGLVADGVRSLQRQDN